MTKNSRHINFALRLLVTALFTSCVLIESCRYGDEYDLLRQNFHHPPASAKPWVFWYWMHGGYSREGITADLEAMKKAGIGGAFLVPIRGVTDPPLYEPSIKQLSPEWWDLVKFTLQEAGRLGITITMHASDGFATAGGPWITPELSMQKLVWSQKQVEGPDILDDFIDRPEAYNNYYRDIAVLAFPAQPGAEISTRVIRPEVSTSQPGIKAGFLANGGNEKRFRSIDSCWIQYAFREPFTCRSITISRHRVNSPFTISPFIILTLLKTNLTNPFIR